MGCASMTSTSPWFALRLCLSSNPIRYRVHHAAVAWIFQETPANLHAFRI
jgi:hypothetical protein